VAHVRFLLLATEAHASFCLGLLIVARVLGFAAGALVLVFGDTLCFGLLFRGGRRGGCGFGFCVFFLLGLLALYIRVDVPRIEDLDDELC
jgi:hypothetical protein